MENKDVKLGIRLTESVEAKLLELCANAVGRPSRSAMIARLIVAEAQRQKVPEQNKRDKDEKTDPPAFR
jgi:hypothetical protein